MLKTIATTAAILAAAPATADSFELSRHGAWTVMLEVTDNGTEFCTMEAVNGRQETLALTANAEDRYTIYMTVDFGSARVGQDVADAHGYGWQTTELEIGRTIWEFEPDMAVHVGSGYVITFTPYVNYEFRRAIARGTVAYHELGGGWSLRGSAAALRDLDQCRQRLNSF